MDNSPYLMTNINLYIQEAQQTPSRKTTKRAIPRNIIVKIFKDIFV